jgi:5-(carboxyamino)imidazole ribonucleotide synthase
MKASQSGGEVVGIVGGGQLGRMLALAGAPLGVECRVLEPGETPPAAIAAECLKASFEDANRAISWANQVDTVTYEFENIPTDTLEAIAATVPVRPSPESLRVSCDRVLEKQLFEKLGIRTTRWKAIGSRQELDQAVKSLGLPLVLKTRKFGYDGKGQAVVRSDADLERAWVALGPAALTVGLLAEELVPFTSEVSQVSVRGLDGASRHYPLTRNVHREGILRFSAPILDKSLSGGLVEQARQWAGLILESLGHVGVLTVEFFENAGDLIANEIAPRVHNSGHWTQDGAETCQFENHLRAVLGWPLGSTACNGYACMVNLVGRIPPVQDVLAVEGAHLHLYGKEVRPGRKVGHINLRCDLAKDLRAGIRKLADLIPGEDVSRWLAQVEAV